MQCFLFSHFHLPGTIRQDDQAPSAHDSALQGAGKEESYGSGGLQNRSKKPEREIQRFRKTNYQGKDKPLAI